MLSEKKGRVQCKRIIINIILSNPKILINPLKMKYNRKDDG